jgi:hypothetical protein
MLSTEPPVYLHPAKTEHGETFLLSFTDYRSLCRNCLAILHAVDHGSMAIAKIDQGAAVDIWCDQGCLTVAVSSEQQTLQLFLADLDSPSLPLLLYQGDTSAKSWQNLKQTALAYR